MARLTSDSDCRVLFKAIARGEEIAFKALFARFRARVYTVAFRWTRSAFASEEITQDVFIAIWVSRAQLPLVRDPEAYIHTVVFNKLSRYLKKESNRSRILRHAAWNVKAFSNETEESVYAHESQQFINRAVAQLPPQRKLIYELNRLQGKSYDEIAKALNLSPHTVKSHLMKAIRFIRDRVKDNALLWIGLLLWMGS